MATIIEIEDKKVEHLSEYAEKVMKYGKKMMECLEEIEEHKYGNRKRMRMREDEFEDYPRYR
jgi:Asp-tRNA(Asn)/Glu-tRNA(Gln) amidotransferase C subunit